MERLETPIWDLDEFTDEVYEPREDTFLLIDALESDLQLLRTSNLSIALEIGSGSGVVITAIASAVAGLHSIAVDINPKACLITKNTSKLNNVEVDVLRSDLVSCLRFNKTIDLLLFNPPYLPSDDSEETNSLLDKAWAGSSRGRILIDRLFPILQQIMSDNCIGYIVTIETNDPEEMKSQLTQLGFTSSIVARRKIIGEKLSILRFSKGIKLLNPTQDPL